MFSGLYVHKLQMCLKSRLIEPRVRLRSCIAKCFSDTFYISSLLDVEMSRLSLLSRLGHAICYFVPAIFGPLLKWVFGISDDSRPLREFRTVFTVAIVKAIFNDPTPVSMLEQQQASLVEVPPESSMWISQDTLSVPLNHNLSEVLRKSAVALANQKAEIPEASAEPVDGEWVGHRNKSHEDRQDEQVFLSNEQAYARLAKDTNQEVVMIYLHGGQF